MICSKTGLITETAFSRFLYYKLVTLVPFCTAVIAITKYSETIHWTLAYIGLCLSHAVIVYTIKCPHCAYYKIGEKTHKCRIFWGVPKIYKERPGPESRFVGIYIPIGMSILTFFPVYWLRFQWELLLLYFLSVGVFVASISLHECSRCIYFECKNNRVPEDVRKTYLETVGARKS